MKRGGGGRPVPLRRGLRVELGERSYPIRIGFAAWEEAGVAIAEATGAQRVAVVTAPDVGRRYGGALERSLRRSRLRVARFYVPDGDRAKTLRQAAGLYRALLAWGADRRTALVALGGGSVGDVAGFVAATYLRGLPFVQVPTTLLAMADASVGGKVAVNLPEGKNLVGAFYQPRLVWIDMAVLCTLSVRQRAAGLAEMIKCAAIWDAALFQSFERHLEEILALDPQRSAAVLERCCAIKAEIVGRDEREGGLRALLNFGHTLGHAVEALSRYRRHLHGEAVAIGMAFAARRSETLGFASGGTAVKLVALLERARLPTRMPDYPRRAYLEALRFDKKRQGKRIRFVLLRSLGRATTELLTPSEILPRRFPSEGGGSPRRTAGIAPAPEGVRGADRRGDRG